ncbi:hypothetical protein ACJX0J_011909, partial [Zea mays]
VPLRKRQCFLLISAGSLSHFFLDHLFEENGHSTMYTWILSTGWWKGRAPINPDAVLVVGLLCTCLMGGYVYINRVNHGRSAAEKSNQSFFLILMIATLYCMWCASQIYLRQPPQPAIVHNRASFKLRSNASVEYSPFNLGSANSDTLPSWISVEAWEQK